MDVVLNNIIIGEGGTVHAPELFLQNPIFLNEPFKLPFLLVYGRDYRP